MLALQFNEPDVEALRARITHKQFVNWQIYYKDNPFGDFRADLRQAITSELVAKAHFKDAKNKKIADFMAITPKRRQQTPEEMKKILDAWVLRGKK